MPEVGESIPPFETQAATGRLYHFPQDLQTPFAIIVVYRKNLCIPCKAQLEYLRDAFPQLLTLGAQIVTLSYPPPEEGAKIAGELKLPYPILSDPEGKVLKLLGAINTDKLSSLKSIHSGLIYPTVLIVDRNGTVFFKLVTKKTATKQEFMQVNGELEKLNK